eukprot:6373830-Pyramimonas_sp.AAC.1
MARARSCSFGGRSPCARPCCMSHLPRASAVASFVLDSLFLPVHASCTAWAPLHSFSHAPRMFRMRVLTDS